MNFVLYCPVFAFRRCKMGKKSSGKKGGLGSMFLTIVKIIVFVFLLANFCYDGKPLWKNVIPSAGKTIEKSEKIIKKETQKAVKAASDAVDDAKKAAEKAAEETQKAADKAVKDTKKTVEETKDSIKNKAVDITEEEEKELEKIIENNIKK